MEEKNNADKKPGTFRRPLSKKKIRMKCDDLQFEIKASTSSDDSTDQTIQLIRKHPLYPALKSLAIKCEKATCSKDADFDVTDTMNVSLFKH